MGTLLPIGSATSPLQPKTSAIRNQTLGNYPKRNKLHLEHSESLITRVMYHLLKHIQWIRPAAYCSREFFLLHDNVPAYKAASVCQILIPKKCYKPLSPPYSPDLSLPDNFMFPKLKMKLRTTLCGCYRDPRSHN